MTINIRFILPVATPFFAVSEDDLSVAACSLLGDNKEKALFIKPEDAERSDGDTTYFAIMETDRGESLIARYFFGGIGRYGGVKPPRDPLQCASLAEVETRLGLEAGAISDCDWSGEESEDEGWERKIRKCRSE